MSDTKQSLGQVTAIGAIWLILQNAGGRAIGFLAQIAIAAILSPKDFGAVGLAYTVSTFGAVLVNFGVESVLLQRQKTIRFWLVPALWYSLSLGSLGFIVVLIAGPIAGRIYNLPQIAVLAAIIGAGMPITALAAVPTVLLRARYQFRTIASLGLAETLLIQGLTIGFALGGLGAYSFVLPLPMVAVLRTVVVWFVTQPDLSGLWRNVSRTKYLMTSSLAVFGTGLVLSAISQGDYVVLGILGNDTSVGIYFFAFKLASQPLLLMAMSLSSVLFPALSQLRTIPKAQGEAALRAAKLMGLLIMPLAFLQAGLVEPAIHLVFETKWNASIPIMQILSIALGFDAIAWIASTLLTAQRGFQRQFVYMMSFAPVFFALIIIGGWQGQPVGVAIGVAIYYVIITPIYSYIVFRRSGATLLRLISLYFIPAIIAIISIGSALLLTAALQMSSNVMKILLTSFLDVTFYTVLLRLVDPLGFDEVLNVLRQIISSLRNTSSKVLPSL